MQKKYRIAILSPVAWRTPPRKYGPWERVVSLLTEGLVKAGVDVTLFATKDSETAGHLHGVVEHGYEEDHTAHAKVAECLHISEVFEHAHEFDLIHNNFDYLPLTYSKLVKIPVLTTIHGFSSPQIVPVFQKYNRHAKYVSISDADRDPSLTYEATVHHGIDIDNFTYRSEPGEYLLFFGRLHPDKGIAEAIEVAKQVKEKLMIAGLIQDQKYFDEVVAPQLSDDIVYVGNVGPEIRDNLLGRAKALLHLINFDEPFGLSVVEAMACGTPVIAINRGSMPEIIVDQTTGFLIKSAAEAPAAIDQLGTIKRLDCRKRVEEKFTVDHMVNGYIRVYERILQ